MEGPALACRVHYVEHLGPLKLQALKLALKGCRRCCRPELAADRVDDRKSRPSEGVLDFTAGVGVHAVFHLIAAEWGGVLTPPPRCADCQAPPSRSEAAMGHGGGAWSPAHRSGSKVSATWRGERSRRRIALRITCNRGAAAWWMRLLALSRYTHRELTALPPRPVPVRSRCASPSGNGSRST